MSKETTRPLIRGVSQFAVDFVIPRMGIDVPIGIDPFLLYKSRDPEFVELHSLLMAVFSSGIEAVKERNFQEARRILSFPEPPEIGFGYTQRSKKGAGVGRRLTELLIETLLASPKLLERGVRHVEEMQLVAIGIGPDRISDITANVLKQFLINYTRKQCDLWKLPIEADVPIEHYFDAERREWAAGHFDLPINPETSEPILLVPRRIVRTLPWINYDDFLRSEFTSVLKGKRESAIDKQEIVAVSRTDVERIDRYVRTKERTAESATPSRSYLTLDDECAETEALKKRLESTPTGAVAAGDYQKLVLEILNVLFSPDLIDGEMEHKTVHGTERRDILFTNDSDESFWSYIRQEHAGIFLMFETKNTNDLDNTHINQTATYLGDRLGRLGFIVARKPAEEAQQLKLYSVFNDSQPRKVILVLSDEDLAQMLDMKCHGNSPMRHIQKLYRKFRTTVQ